ncbi:MAG: sensor histidine kinase [Acidimicrobiales bacterium]
MQRRFTIALVSTALVSILLVGFGVLAMAQLGARGNAEDQVSRGLRVVDDLLVSSLRESRQIETSVTGLRSQFDLAFLQPVTITSDGRLAAREVRPGRGPTERLRAFPDVVLDSEQLALLAEGETVLISAPRFVYGVRVLEVERPNGQPSISIALLAGQNVSAVTSQTVAWFLLSSMVVLGGALLAGIWLAKRLIGPLKAIEATTSAIAGGNLAARVTHTGKDEVADLGNAVNQMASDLERSKALDRQFLMSVSHDLKTPLTAIAGYAEALSDGAVTDPKAAGDVISSQAHRLEHLVGDLLDLARLDANRFTLQSQTFDLAVVAGRSVAGMVNRAEKRGIALRRSDSSPLMVVADPDRTAQAIGNLIDNAIKFAKTTIVVELISDAISATVSVSDDGPGISPEDLEHIFDRLYTGSAQPRQAENPTGLGLAIVRELASAMGGHVVAANNPNGGAKLSLSLPLTTGTTAAGAAEAVAGPPELL